MAELGNNEYNDAMKVFNNIHQGNIKLNSDNEILKADNVMLKADSEVLKAANEILKSDNGILKADIGHFKAVKSDNEVLKAANEILKSDIGHFKSVNSDNGMLRAEVKRLELSISQNKEELNDYVTALKLCEVSVHQHSVNDVALKNDKKKLREEIEALLVELKNLQNFKFETHKLLAEGIKKVVSDVLEKQHGTNL